MVRKIFKIVTVVLLLALLTMPNFIFVGTGLASYAVDNTATSHQNVEFDAELKEGNILSVTVNVKREGYFNGEITLEDSNFTFKTEQANAYINKLESNKIILNQINAGTTAQIDLNINPVSEEIFNAGLLNALSKINLTGIYRDSTEKDIKITGTKEVEFKYEEKNTNEDLENTTKIITNKVLNVSGEEKRVIQLEMNLGLKNNNYPIKEIEVNMDVPEIDNKLPTIVKKIDFNTMTHYDYNYENAKINIKFTNEANESNNILWRKQGNENVILTFIYDKNAKIEDAKYVDSINDKAIGQPTTKVTLYDGKELNSISNLSINDLMQEKEELIRVNTINLENEIYKGKLNAGIDRQYVSKTNISVNLANAEQYIIIKEDSDNTIINKTVINKEEFNKVLGEDGQIKFLNEDSNILATVDNKTEVDEDGNFIIDYTGKEPKLLEVKMTTPIKEGNIELINTKTIKAMNDKTFKDISELVTNTTFEYNKNDLKETKSSVKLIDTKAEATLLINKDTLSTVVENNIEMKVTLKGNNEKYSLYNNPSFAFELPADVENISINSINLVYENELKVRSYDILERILIVHLEGKQTEYKNSSVEGAVLVIDANLTVNKKAASKDAKISVSGLNNDEEVSDSKNIRIVAPKDVTAINSIKDLSIETIGEEETKNVAIKRGSDAKVLETTIELINNNENAIENVKIMGTFPTKNKQNNINIKINEEIKLDSAENVKIYYSENENATDDILNAQNAWNEKIIDSSEVKKYLIVVPSIEKQASIKGTYKFEIPELLEYNQFTSEGYTSKYVNSLTKIENEVKSTIIKLETGVGPILQTKITPYLGGNEITDNLKVKNGEIIKFKIELSNTGSENINNVNVTANIPEGTTLVTPYDNYEYTGASYYKELPNKMFETTIENINVGEVKNLEFETRVNSNVQENTILVSSAQIKYGDVVKKSNDVQISTTKGDLRVSVKRVTDRKVNLYESGTVQYFAILENISDEKQENIKIKTNLPESLKVEKLELITGMPTEEILDNDLYNVDNVKNIEEETINESESTVDTSETSIKSEKIEYSDLINIDSLEKGEVKVLSYNMLIDRTENKRTDFSIIAMKGNTEYKSNIIEDKINNVQVSISMTSNTQNEYIKSGDSLQYIINVKNNATDRLEGLVVKDKIPESLTVEKVIFDGQEVSELKDINDIEISCNIAAQSNAEIIIETSVNYSAARTSAEAITNIAYAEMLGDKVATTQEVSHIIEADEKPIPGSDSEEPNPDIASGNKMITGMAWFDENANGQKDDGEKTLSNIKVHLLNTETNNLVKNANGNVLEAITNENGVYVLDKLFSGKYIVIFEYNETLYTLTKYKVENVEESKNSNVMTNELLIENQKQAVPSTDIIQINDNNISNVNIGLIELKDFAFRLDKFVNRVLIQNAAGTTLKEYTNATVAKAELDSKKINGTNVIIEYEIKVTNIGEIDGYVRKVVDYMPNDLKFSSELNKDWYQTGSDLYNSSLANEKIPAGESRSVKLTLTKAMTENNTGLINNTAEIAESYNELGIADSKSKSANRAQGESDYGSADTILSLKTGGDVYVTVIAVIIAILGSITFVIIIRKQKIEGIK